MPTGVCSSKVVWQVFFERYPRGLLETSSKFPIHFLKIYSCPANLAGPIAVRSTPPVWRGGWWRMHTVLHQDISGDDGDGCDPSEAREPLRHPPALPRSAAADWAFRWGSCPQHHSQCPRPVSTAAAQNGWPAS